MTTPDHRRIYLDVHTAEALLTAASDAESYWTEWRQQPDFHEHYTEEDIASAVRRQVERATARDALQAALDEHRREEAALTASRPSPSPYDTGARLEPKAWPTDGDPDRYGRVDLDNNEGATVATVHAGGTAHGYDLDVTDHCGALTVYLDGRPMMPAPAPTTVDPGPALAGPKHDGLSL